MLKSFASQLKALPAPPWIPNEGPQALAYLSPADELFYGGSAGGGKAEALDAKILTPFGWTEMGRLKVGSKVCAPDGTVTTVIAVHPQGAKDLYRVTMRDGGSVECCLEHIWLAWRTHASQEVRNRAVAGAAGARKYTTAQIMEEMGKGRRADGRNIAFAIPVTRPVAFNVAGGCVGRGNFVGRLVDPYLLGLLIGDGCYTGNSTVSLTTADAEIENHIVGAFGEDVAVRQTGSTARALIFRGKSLIKLESDLHDIGVFGSRAATKKIPRIYLLAPVEDRWALLQGLMDTDGWAEPGRAIYYTTISRDLADDVVFLARSLGAVTSVTEKDPTYTHNGEKKNGQKAYCIRIKLPHPEMAFRLTRKREIAAGIEHQCEGRVIESIEFSRRAEAQCITVAHPHSLYITDDFIVTHNSALLLGLALTAHVKSLILRVEATNLQELKDILMSFKGAEDHWRSIGYGGVLDTHDGRRVEMSGCDGMTGAEKFRGRAHDAKLWDELPQFPESTFRFVNAWNRTTVDGQRCRIVGAGNPPSRPEEEWVIRYWAPWLDVQHPRPAEPGELRWFAVVDGKDVEVESGAPFTHKSEVITPRSRTFVPARLSDNPDLEKSGYRATLQGLPEPLRSQLLYGDMTAGRADDDWQLIPTAWVRQSMRAWQADGRGDKRMTAASLDVARGGADKSVLCKRYGMWVAPLQAWPGIQTPDGPALIVKVLPHLESLHMPLLVDVLATAGGGAVDSFKYALPGLKVRPINFGAGSSYKDKTGRLEMKNLRAEAYFRLREALDPASSQPRLLLPDDSELLSEICSVRWKEVAGGKVQLESKDDIKERMGRSPDRADAVAMSMLCHGAAEWLVPEKKGEADGRDRRRERNPSPGRYGSGSFMGVG